MQRLYAGIRAGLWSFFTDLGGSSPVAGFPAERDSEAYRFVLKYCRGEQLRRRPVGRTERTVTSRREFLKNTGRMTTCSVLAAANRRPTLPV
jgi:hypothetical protein